MKENLFGAVCDHGVTHYYKLATRGDERFDDSAH